MLAEGTQGGESALLFTAVVARRRLRLVWSEIKEVFEQRERRTGA